ncbi:glycosyltransferase family 39 protein [Alloprevotella tannerae]|uniref:ArnT family glycosyltransferase n=1 Tax=Alloprevotella tannerae TaxID=76122 RepID=UPI001EDBA28D|nr:glycosyltransferase family 39 protein [Alloprevotella tannerae]MCG2653044.1 glycosyltransferase family 39 protein [Alloprevotella tannerae]
MIESSAEHNTRLTRTWIYLALLIFIVGLTIFPFLGLQDFNTKGEPREAVVASTMLETGNWILPRNNGGETAYKPPMLHWCVATLSAPLGKVSEYTARIPSAAAATVLALMTFLFFAKRSDVQQGFWASLIFLTTFEVHRAAATCRVDMLLTLFIVGALFQLYQWYERDMKGVPLLAILFMSAGMLAKGPVAIFLPCFVTFIFLWIQSTEVLWRIVLRLMGVALLALLLPAVWYYAAYQQGGESFLQLVYEENVLRFLGKMTYASHENGWYYYFPILAAGLLPYTLTLLFSIFGRPRNGAKYKPVVKINFLRRITEGLRSMNSVELFSFLSILLIFIFYCIPKSKRSVYILPIYPFLSFYIAKLFAYLRNEKPFALRVTGALLAAIAFIVPFGVLAVCEGWIKPSIFHGKHAVENAFLMQNLAAMDFGFLRLLFIIAPIIAAIYYLFHFRDRFRIVQAIFILVFGLYISLEGLFLPLILNPRSDKNVAVRLEQISHQTQHPVYAYVHSTDANNPLHFFTINFYMGNRLQAFDGKQAEGQIIVGEEDLKQLEAQYPAFVFIQKEDLHHRSCDVGQNIGLYTFARKAADAQL